MKTVNTRRQRQYAWNAGVVALVLLSTLVMPSMGASAQPAQPAQPECAPLVAGGPLWVTADCVDPLYNQPVIDSETDLSSPVPHHKVSGHFAGTDKRFNLYFPPREQWEGRFFQSVYPLQDENAIDDPTAPNGPGRELGTAGSIAFGADSGAYTVQTNGGGGYRVDAAAAKFSKLVAADYYGKGRHSRRIYGYIYGGSGGSYQTIGAIENSSGVWDGAVPFIPGVPTSIPNNFFVRAFARLVLTDKAPQIADAVSPGGSGDPYAGLSEVEQSVLREVTRIGVPLRAWEDYPYLLGLTAPDGLLGFGAVIRGIDTTYADDFWSKPGYLGSEQSALGAIFRAALVDHIATITQVNRDAQNAPTSLILDSVPALASTLGLDYTLYAADGTTRVGTLAGSLDPTTKVFTIGSGNSASVLSAIDTGARLRIDNRWDLALRSYHRHQVPRRPGYYAWDQFRGPDGQPIYPQRFLEIGPLITGSVSGGGTHTGMINAKIIVVANLLDVDAYPWHADWYVQRVKEALGSRFNDSFRLWYNDNADHIPVPRTPRLVQYDGIVQQALRDVSLWVERGVEPARSTRYQVEDSQVTVPGRAGQRRGIQPVVDLTVNHADRIDITAGQTVTFVAKIQVPARAGWVVAAEWDFLGTGEFTASPFGSPRRTVVLKTTFTYTTPGTYFPALRATSQREGDTSTPFALVQNLGRVRVVVH